MLKKKRSLAVVHMDLSALPTPLCSRKENDAFQNCNKIRKREKKSCVLVTY